MWVYDSKQGQTLTVSTLTHVFRHDESVSPGSAEVLDGAAAAVVLDAPAHALRPVPLRHDHLGQHQTIVVQQVPGL